MQHNRFESTYVKYRPRQKSLQNTNTKFMQQKISFEDTPIFFPQGMEKFFLLLYFISLPYVAGTFFLFMYVGKGKTDLYLSINEKFSFIISWAIGYEIIAALILLWIIKSAISFSANNSKRKGSKKPFIRP